MMNQKGFGIVLILIGVLVVVGLIGGAYYFGKSQTPKPQSQNPIVTSQTSIPTPSAVPGDDETANPGLTGANWKIYTYKKISFKYPDDWVVVFDSEVAGQPYGFSLHIQRTTATGLQPDELILSTYNDRRGTANDYQLRKDRVFNSSTENNSDHFEFIKNNTPIYADCAYHKFGQETVDICNKILFTFRFTN